jgi:hypothetical protein
VRGGGVPRGTPARTPPPGRGGFVRRENPIRCIRLHGVAWRCTRLHPVAPVAPGAAGAQSVGRGFVPRAAQWVRSARRMWFPDWVPWAGDSLPVSGADRTGSLSQPMAPGAGSGCTSRGRTGRNGLVPRRTRVGAMGLFRAMGSFQRAQVLTHPVLPGNAAAPRGASDRREGAVRKDTPSGGGIVAFGISLYYRIPAHPPSRISPSAAAACMGISRAWRELCVGDRRPSRGPRRRRIRLT